MDFAHNGVSSMPDTNLVDPPLFSQHFLSKKQWICTLLTAEGMDLCIRTYFPPGTWPLPQDVRGHVHHYRVKARDPHGHGYRRGDAWLCRPTWKDFWSAEQNVCHKVIYIIYAQLCRMTCHMTISGGFMFVFLLLWPDVNHFIEPHEAEDLFCHGAQPLTHSVPTAKLFFSTFTNFQVYFSIF